MVWPLKLIKNYLLTTFIEYPFSQQTDVVVPLTDANADTVASTTERIVVTGPTSYNPPLVARTLTGQHSELQFLPIFKEGTYFIVSNPMVTK